MLSDQDKARIVEEETYRRQALPPLDAIAPRGNRWERAWGFANSALFIWFASSVVLGAVSFLYNRWEKAFMIERENQRLASRLDAEITNRLVFVDHLAALQSAGVRDSKTTDIVPAAVAALERPSAVDYPVSVFPEYKDRNLRSLLWELVQVAPKKEKEEIRGVYRRSLELQVLYMENFNANRAFGTAITNKDIVPASQAAALAHSYVGIRNFCCGANLKRWGSPFEEMVSAEGWCSAGKN
jgi:hypothetical protein